MKEIKEEKDSSTKLSKEVSKLEDNLKRITEEAASQASAAHELGESAKEAKAKVDAAYAKVRTFFLHIHALAASSQTNVLH